MVKLAVATANKGKLAEIRELLQDGFEVIGISDTGFKGEIAETGTTFRENAFIKASTIAKHTGLPTLADDSGLEVFALNGDPGVFSARYAGSNATDAENCDKLLQELQPFGDRSARFVCCICLVINNKEYFFEGELTGKIALQPSGSNGFGYDPVFIPEAGSGTLANYTQNAKNAISHRGKAMTKAIDFLKQHLS